ncbi:MAG: Lrp/AsnC family transcriptional regulator [Candidatus Omnitrophica bacterium]|nr:Lrp/AsnC family transcriptional regulator [Candidatus Omnitrophota bacterium]
MRDNLLDKKDKDIMIMLQEGLPLTLTPYKDIADKLGMPEDEMIHRARRLKDMGLIKRIDFRLDLRKMGFASTLVACSVPEKDIQNAKDVILKCGNVTHNYLRRHKFNMWFTLSAGSMDKLKKALIELKEKLHASPMLSFQTKDILKLGFRLDVK